jgi:hypothetical protein
MSRWFRVFGTKPDAPDPATLIEYLREHGTEASGNFKGDEQGWFHAEFDLGGDWPSLRVERYLAKEDGIRNELNAWAAWIETFESSPHRSDLMQRIVTTAQLFAIEGPEQEGNEARTWELWTGLCSCLARHTSGVYQIDSQGFFNANRALLLAE